MLLQQRFITRCSNRATPLHSFAACRKRSLCRATHDQMDFNDYKLNQQDPAGAPMASSNTSDRAGGHSSAAAPRTGPRRSLQDALTTSLTEVSRLKGRMSDRTNLMMVDGDEDTWRRLDSRVNKYPREAEFTAIGSGGDSFKSAMIAAVEEVVGNVHSECISERQSAKGLYISVRLSCFVEKADDVIRIYENMRRDERLKYFI